MASSNGHFQLQSPAFADGQPIPSLYAAEGLDLSPPLRWSGEPSHTRCFTLWMEDPDAAEGHWIHWVLFNIPGGQHRLPAGLERQPQLANGACHASCGGVLQFPRLGYQGPQPPRGELHRYAFLLYAMNQPLPLRPGSCPVAVRQAMQGHVLASARLVGTYGSG